MRVFKLLSVVLLAAGFSFAGKVVTYTATSTVSQEEANNTAMAGVAKQISSQVTASQTLSKSESTTNGKSSLTENYRSKSQVTSNINIKGISVAPVKTDKGYKATATLDLDEYTADIQLQMTAHQERIAELEKSIRTSMDERQYAKGISALNEAKTKITEYGNMLNSLASVYPVNEKHQLHHSIPELESKIIERLSQIRIEGPSEEFTLTNSEMPPWNASVLDDKGPLSNFPLVAKQGYQTLLERRTQADGTATFNLRNVNFNKGPYVIVIEPNLPEDILNAAGLRQKFTLSYQVKQAVRPVRISCKESVSICNALEKALAQKAIVVEDNPSVPQLELKVNATEGKTLKINDITRYSYNVDLALKGQNISFITSAKENGKNAADAIVKAIAKMDFSKLQQQIQSK